MGPSLPCCPARGPPSSRGAPRTSSGGGLPWRRSYSGCVATAIVPAHAPAPERGRAVTEPRDPAADDGAPTPAASAPGHPSLMQQMAHPDLSSIPAEEIEAAERLDLPGVNENVEEGAVPPSRRLRSPRTIIQSSCPSWCCCSCSRPSRVQAGPAAGAHLAGQPVVAAGRHRHLLRRLPASRVTAGRCSSAGTGYPLKVKDSTEIILIKLAGQLRRARQAW